MTHQTECILYIELWRQQSGLQSLVLAEVDVEKNEYPDFVYTSIKDINNGFFHQSVAPMIGFRL
jgi:hypothetical protein